MRREFEMTEDDHKALLEACQPVPMIALQCGTPPSLQQRANDAWADLGRRMGFDSSTVLPSAKGDRFFTAVPIALVPEPNLRQADPEQAADSTGHNHPLPAVLASLSDGAILNGYMHALSWMEGTDGEDFAAADRDWNLFGAERVRRGLPDPCRRQVNPEQAADAAGVYGGGPDELGGGGHPEDCGCRVCFVQSFAAACETPAPAAPPALTPEVQGVLWAFMRRVLAEGTMLTAEAQSLDDRATAWSTRFVQRFGRITTAPYLAKDLEDARDIIRNQAAEHNAVLQALGGGHEQDLLQAVKDLVAKVAEFKTLQRGFKGEHDHDDDYTPTVQRFHPADMVDGGGPRLTLAERLVHHRHSKWALVYLVHALLCERDAALEKVAELESELERTEAYNADLADAFAGRVTLREITIKHGIDIKAADEPGGILHYMAAQFFELLEQHNAPNFVTYDFKTIDGKRISATVQKVDGKTPTEKLVELKSQVEELQALIAFMDAHVPVADSSCDEPGIVYSEACRREMHDLADLSTPEQAGHGAAEHPGHA